ncbi:orotidine-5'-phosphate decarboxylase [Candidatus Aerophobetes bacterium]|nr:orotidine-5'-phosphate decarboxylase [Candidatus Aerophobetes bacterium]
MQPESRLILALDVNNEKEVQNLVLALKKWIGFFKIGMRLFFRYGPEVVNEVKSMGGRVFLDAKLYDIPSVVESAVKAIGKMGVDMLTVHALGGVEMMRRSINAIRENNYKTKILGVTILTSFNQESLKKELGIRESIKEKVLFLAAKAKEAGLDGVICSGEEIKILRDSFGPGFLLVVPGIRTGGIKGDEQRRILTPEEAVNRGADYLVIGRPILQAPDPVEATKKIAERISGISFNARGKEN